jgi:ABC-type multidrug transport system fused ATPase/permease subunit
MNYDKVVVMNSGVVEEFGTPVELMERKGAFYILATTH